MSDTPIRDAIKKLETDPITKTAEFGVVASDAGGVGAAAAVSTTLGKGWSVNAQGQWQHKTGWQLGAVVRWKGK